MISTVCTRQHVSNVIIMYIGAFLPSCLSACACTGVMLHARMNTKDVPVIAYPDGIASPSNSSSSPQSQTSSLTTNTLSHSRSLHEKFMSPDRRRFANLKTLPVLYINLTVICMRGYQCLRHSVPQFDLVTRQQAFPSSDAKAPL
jgi:hypothetical protein